MKKVQFTKTIDIKHQTPNNRKTKIHRAKIRGNIREKKNIYDHSETY